MPDLLRVVWAEPAPEHPPEPAWRDWALVGVLVCLVVLEGVLRTDVAWRVASVVLMVGLAPTLLWRRTRPLAMVAIGFGVSGVAPLFTGGEQLEFYTQAFLLLLPYSLIRWGSGRAAVLGGVIIAAKMSIAAAVGQLTVAELIGGFAVMSSAMALGAAARFRARARSRELDQAKLRERERLARDLHDTVAHHVSAVAIRAQAGLAMAATHPDAATDALRVIEAEASRALAEMRAMVRVLRRHEPVDLAPRPHIGDLRQLAATARGGPTVEVDIVGDLDDVAPSVGAAVFRLAQESVTNARRHARHATRIDVHLAADDTSVRLRISDDGEAGHPRSSGPAGFGLVGMRERAGLLGGSCEAGPDPAGGWTVTAVLPRAGIPA